MAARTPRRTFASSFVVTLAAIPAASMGCNPPPPQSPGAHGHVNPPPPAYVEPATPATPAAEPAAPAPPPPPAQPPAAEPADAPPTHAARWHVTKRGDACMAQPHVECPTGAPGQPVPTCNPPPPRAYECPPNMTEASLTVERRPGDPACFVERAPMRCPEGARCNPPPPRRVACPKP